MEGFNESAEKVVKSMKGRTKEIKLLQENLNNANNGIIELKENIAQKRPACMSYRKFQYW